jgi:hypothetical protein
MDALSRLSVGAALGIAFGLAAVLLMLEAVGVL